MEPRFESNGRKRTSCSAPLTRNLKERRDRRRLATKKGTAAHHLQEAKYIHIKDMHLSNGQSMPSSRNRKSGALVRISCNLRLSSLNRSLLLYSPIFTPDAPQFLYLEYFFFQLAGRFYFSFYYLLSVIQQHMSGIFPHRRLGRPG